jgi:hypothetical protein
MPDTDPPEDSSSPELDALARELRLDFRNIREGFSRLVLVQWLSFRTRAVSAAFSAALLLCLFGFCVSAVVLSASFLANGVRRALGDVGAGFAILGAIAAIVLGLRAWFKIQGVRSAQRAMENDFSEESS